MAQLKKGSTTPAAYQGNPGDSKLSRGAVTTMLSLLQGDNMPDWEAEGSSDGPVYNAAQRIKRRLDKGK